MPKNIIKMDISFESCVQFAEELIAEEKYVEAMQNLNEAMQLAKKEKKDAFEAVSQMFYIMSKTDNYQGALDVAVLLLSVMQAGRENYYFDNIEECIKDIFPMEAGEEMSEFSPLFINIVDIRRREYFIRAQEYVANEQHDLFLLELNTLYFGSGKYSQKVIMMFLNDCAPTFKGAKKARMLEEIMSISDVDPMGANPFILEYVLSQNIDKYSSMLEANAGDILADLFENPLGLLCVGVGFMKCSKFDVANIFLRQALKLNPHEEETMWTMALNYYLMGDREEGRVWLNKYAAMFGVGSVPIQLYRKFMETAPMPVDYPFVSVEFLGKQFFDMIKDADLGNEFDYKMMGQILFVAPEKSYEIFTHALDTYRVDGPSEKARIAMALELLRAPRVQSALKPFIMRELVSSSYEGPVTIVYEQRFISYTMRRFKDTLLPCIEDSYSELIGILPFVLEHIPMHFKMMRKIATDMNKKLLTVTPLSKDTYTAVTYAMLCLYAKKVGVKINNEFYRTYFGIKKTEKMKKCLELFEIK